MGSFDVDAKISDVHDLELAIRRFDESSREIVEAASRSLKDIIAKINDDASECDESMHYPYDLGIEFAVFDWGRLRLPQRPNCVDHQPRCTN